jgi:hypothetical protein
MTAAAAAGCGWHMCIGAAAAAAALPPPRCAHVAVASAFRRPPHPLHTITYRHQYINLVLIGGVLRFVATRRVFLRAL